MKSIPAWVLFSLICLSFSVNCKADVIYSNLGPGDEVAAGSLVLGAVSASDSGAASEQNAAQLFQSGRNFNITSFTVGVDVAAGSSIYSLSPVFDAYL
jgi:hypothetical protein